VSSDTLGGRSRSIISGKVKTQHSLRGKHESIVKVSRKRKPKVILKYKPRIMVRCAEICTLGVCIYCVFINLDLPKSCFPRGMMLVLALQRIIMAEAIYKLDHHGS
jgi:hypothetical protein